MIRLLMVREMPHPVDIYSNITHSKILTNFMNRQIQDAVKIQLDDDSILINGDGVEKAREIIKDSDNDNFVDFPAKEHRLIKLMALDKNECKELKSDFDEMFYWLIKEDFLCLHNEIISKRKFMATEKMLVKTKLY